jgi:hypothetical protein
MAGACGIPPCYIVSKPIEETCLAFDLGNQNKMKENPGQSDDNKDSK